MDSGDFRLLDRQVVEALQRMPERDRYLRGMISWAGFRQIALPYHRAGRFAGVSKYPLGKLMHLAADGLLSFSLAPLRLAVWLGLATTLVSLLAFAGMCTTCLIGSSSPGPTAWLALAVAMFAGAQLICLGIVGEYIGRIYREIKHRPLYIVSQTLPRRAAGQQKIVRAA
jgi:dolichol-phosphate mannosyltransferase